MLSLPAELDALCSRLLARCEQLDSARSLRAVFVTDDLAPFANGLPERAGSKTGFVAAVKLFLLETRLADGRVLLLPFLDAARAVYPPEDALRGELDDLYERVLALPQATAPINRQDDAPQPPPDPPATRDAREVTPVRLLRCWTARSTPTSWPTCASSWAWTSRTWPAAPRRARRAS